MKRITMLLVVLAALATVAARAQDQARLLREAINKETVDGDCKGAIEIYKTVAGGADRALAAQALLRMAGCYEKLGSEQAKQAYEQVIQKYGGQPEAAEARARLATSGAVSAYSQEPFRRVEADSRLGYFDVLSPDGNLVVDETYDTPLVERDLRTNREVLLLSTERDASRFPAPERPYRAIRGPYIWSADSKDLAFTVASWGGGIPGEHREIRIYQRSTGSMTTVAAGQQVSLQLVARTNAGDVLYSRESAPDATGQRSTEYFIVPPTGGEPRRVLDTLTRAPRYSEAFGDFTADGRSAIIVRQGRLVMVDLATNAEQNMTLGINAAAPTVSPDGRLLAFLSKQSGQWALYVYPLDRLPIRDPIHVSPLEPDINVQGWRKPRWTKDGRLTFDHEAGGRNVYRIDVDNKTARPLGRPERLTHEIPGVIAWVSPDGRRIAYNVFRTGGIAVMDADGSNVRRLTESPDDHVRGWRSNDEVLFIVRGSSTVNVIKVANINSGAVNELPYQLTGVARPWQYLVRRNELIYNDGGSLSALSIADGQSRMVVQGKFFAFQFSDDGTRFATSRNDQLDIFGVGPGETAVPIGSLKAPHGGLPRAWSPRGTHLVYEAGDGLRILDVVTLQSWPLMDAASAAALFGPDTTWDWWGEASWAPDGSFITATISAIRRIRLTFEGVTYDAVNKIMAGR